MRTELEQEDIKAIAREVVEMLKPLLVNAGKSDDEVIFDVKGLSEYLKASKQWIYERTHLKEIPHIKLDGQLRFRKKDIDKWVMSHNIPASNTPENIIKKLNK